MIFSDRQPEGTVMLDGLGTQERRAQERNRSPETALLQRIQIPVHAAEIDHATWSTAGRQT